MLVPIIPLSRFLLVYQALRKAVEEEKANLTPLYPVQSYEIMEI